MRLELRDSSCIRSVHAIDGDLIIQFCSSKKRYVYYDVPLEVVSRWAEASSVGVYYHKYIRGKYEYEVRTIREVV